MPIDLKNNPWPIMYQHPEQITGHLQQIKKKLASQHVQARDFDPYLNYQLLANFKQVDQLESTYLQICVQLLTGPQPNILHQTVLVTHQTITQQIALLQPIFQKLKTIQANLLKPMPLLDQIVNPNWKFHLYDYLNYVNYHQDLWTALKSFDHRLTDVTHYNLTRLNNDATWLRQTTQQTCYDIQQRQNQTIMIQYLRRIIKIRHLQMGLKRRLYHQWQTMLTQPPDENLNQWLKSQLSKNGDYNSQTQIHV